MGKPLSLRGWIVHALFLLAAFGGGLLLFLSRVGAQPAPPPRPAKVGLGLHVASASASAPASPASASLAASASAPPPPSADPAPSASAPTPLDLAVVGPKGGVPVQPEGHYRSPFANPKWGPPTKVQVGALMQAIRNYDIKLGTFEADFHLGLWSEKAMPPMDLTFPNGKVDTKEVLADKPTFKLYRIVGTFHAPPDLRKYPFDAQELQVEIEEDSSGFDVVRFQPSQEHTNLDSDFGVIGWDVIYVEARSLAHYYPDRFVGDDLYYSKYILRIGIERFGTAAIFTVYVPAIVIVLIALFGMWVPPDEMEVRANAGPPMLAAAVLFHFSLMQSLPATPYLTKADKLMLGVYVSLLLGIASTWLFFVFDTKHWRRLFRVARATVPPLTAGVLAVAILA